MTRSSLHVIAVILAAVLDAAAQQPVFVVRHAERVDAGPGPTMMATDPDLSDAGRTRARSLAATLKDAGITAIFVTEYKRTQQTAEPLASNLGMKATVVNAKDVQGLVDRVKAASGPVLIVGHSNTLPEILSGLGIEKPPKLADTDYDNLFIVHRSETSVMIRLHYR